MDYSIKHELDRKQAYALALGAVHRATLLNTSDTPLTLTRAAIGKLVTCKKRGIVFMSLATAPFTVLDTSYTIVGDLELCFC